MLRLSLLLNLIVYFTYTNTLSLTNERELTYNLPKNVYPSSYIISLLIDFESSKFSGVERISLQVLNPTSSISIHSKNLIVKWENAVVGNSVQTFRIVNVIVNDTDDIAKLELERQIPQGVYNLDISFVGNSTFDKTLGLHTTGNKYGVTTNFYPNKARTVFPCFDEPEFKAEYLIEITHHENYVALSNMPQVYSDPVNNTAYYVTKFQRSFKMSTHSLAFSISMDIEFSMPDYLIRIFGQAEDIANKGFWAFDFGTRALAAVEKWLNSVYKLPKLDFLSVRELPTSNVNTWGLLRIKEPYLFYDEKIPSEFPVDIHQKGALLMLKGILSTWIGNDVTPKEWKDSWMTEGFLTYLQYLLAEKLLPEWRLFEQFVVEETEKALSFVESKSEDDINARFGSIIRMLHAALGDTVFQKSVQNYINNSPFEVSQPNRLFGSIQTTIDQEKAKLPASVKVIFENWLSAENYPVVNASLVFNGDTVFIKITQKELVPRHLQNNQEKVARDQFIPISILYEGSQKPYATEITWLEPSHTSLEVTLTPPLANQSWFIVNNGVIGLYRVNYHENNWNLLIKELTNRTSNAISAVNKAQLIDDSFNLARNGELDIKIALDVLKNVKHETDFIPWTAAKNAFIYLENMLRGTVQHDWLEIFIQNITNETYNKVPISNTFEGDHEKRLLRRNVAKLACEAGLSTCVNYVQSVFSNYLNKTEFPGPELHELSFCTATKYTNFSTALTNSLIKYVMQMITNKEEVDRSVVYKVLSGVGCTRDEKLIKRAIEITTTVLPPAFNIEIKPGDREYLFKSVAVGSYRGTKEALIYIKNNFVAMRARFESLANVFDAIAPHITTDELLTLLKDAIVAHKSKFTQQVQAAAQHAVDQGERNIKWVKTYNGSISKWLKNNVHLENENSDENNSSNNSYSKMLILFSVLVSLLFTSSYSRR